MSDTSSPEARPGEKSGPTLRIELPIFDGPLDLLLHLIRKHELEILDLPIAFVTERYLEYLALMREFDLDVASEYLLMAATLAHIKSRMLLPREPEGQTDGDEELDLSDPRTELIQRLLEYQKYKHAAEAIGNRAIVGRDVFPRGMSAPAAEGPAPLAEIGLFKLLDAFEGILKRAKGTISLEVDSERITIQERMTQLTELLRVRRSCPFEDLFEGTITRYEIVVTFLALLEMTRMHLTRIYQRDHESPLHVHFALLDPDAPTIPPPEGEAHEAGAAPARLEAVVGEAVEAMAATDDVVETLEAEADEADESDIASDVADEAMAATDDVAEALEAVADEAPKPDVASDVADEATAATDDVVEALDAVAGEADESDFASDVADEAMAATDDVAEALEAVADEAPKPDVASDVADEAMAATDDVVEALDAEAGEADESDIASDVADEAMAATDDVAEALEAVADEAPKPDVASDVADEAMAA
ncbi:MAG: segregation/condensation protein A, partial [Myxococcales bacterium]|nr:segregation/condensation protein A [Myxococcales bacterium]